MRLFGIVGQLGRTFRAAWLTIPFDLQAAAPVVITPVRTIDLTGIFNTRRGLTGQFAPTRGLTGQVPSGRDLMGG